MILILKYIITLLFKFVTYILHFGLI